MESLGLTGVLACVSPLRSCTVKVPENTETHREPFRRKLSNPRHERTAKKNLHFGVSRVKAMCFDFLIRIIEIKTNPEGSKTVFIICSGMKKYKNRFRNKCESWSLLTTTMNEGTLEVLLMWCSSPIGSKQTDRQTEGEWDCELLQKRPVYKTRLTSELPALEGWRGCEGIPIRHAIR